jgi:hypothetical protein
MDKKYIFSNDAINSNYFSAKKQVGCFLYYDGFA